MEILNNEYIELSYDKQSEIITLIWKEVVTSEEYRKAFSVILDAVIENKIPRYLADTSNQGEISPIDRKWLETEIIPKAIKGGLKYIATVLKKDAFKKYYLSKVQKKSTSEGIAFEMFDDIDKAKEWLLSKSV